MVERAPILDTICHVILIAGALLVCVPLYFAFVAGSLSIAEVQKVPLPWLPGNQFFANLQTAWVKADFSRTFLNSIVVAVGIAAGKIAVSLLSAFAITYFRFRYRMLAFWLIFMSLMLPIEVRIVPTFEAVANAALPLQWLADVLHVAGLWKWISGHDITIALEWNMVNTYSGLILPLIASATATFLFRQFFLTVPDELCEAARLDGASPLRFFWSILLPLSVSNIVALAIILFLFGCRNLRGLGVVAVEFDVHQSVDGGLVVIHDPLLDRTTHDTGPVGVRTLKQLTTTQLREAGEERIPTLDTVLDLFNDSELE